MSAASLCWGSMDIEADRKSVALLGNSIKPLSGVGDTPHFPSFCFWIQAKKGTGEHRRAQNLGKDPKIWARRANNAFFLGFGRIWRTVRLPQLSTFFRPNYGMVLPSTSLSGEEFNEMPTSRQTCRLLLLQQRKEVVFLSFFVGSSVPKVPLGPSEGTLSCLV